MTGMDAPPAGGVEFLDLRFAALDMAGAVRWIRDAMAGPRFRYVVTPNVDHLVRFHTAGAESWHPAFAQAEREADLLLNDSRILRRLARLSGVDLPLVPGSDLTRVLLADGALPATRVALIGGGAAEAEWLRARLPGATVLHLQPAMGVLRDAEAQAAIAAFVEHERAQLTLFAIGAPQSEMVAHLIRARGVAGGVGLCIGASMEFLTGAKRRAPLAFQRLGLEWAFRLGSEPRRLWRRYLVEGPRIFAIWRKWRRRWGG